MVHDIALGLDGTRGTLESGRAGVHQGRSGFHGFNRVEYSGQRLIFYVDH